MNVLGIYHSLIGTCAETRVAGLGNYMEIFLAACSIMVPVPRNPVTHASPLGRAHTEPVNPGEVGCDRPERPSGSERAGFVT